jgi:fatty acid desaturase
MKGANPLVLAGSPLTVSFFFNRRQWRRFRAAQERPLRRKAAFLTAMVLGAAALYGLPFLLFMTATDRTAPPLFPGSWS